MAADQQHVFSRHRDEVVSALEMMSLSFETDAEGLPYKVLRDHVRELVAGRGPPLPYEDVREVHESLNAMADTMADEPEAPTWERAAEEVADLLDEMQVAHLRPHLDPIYETLDVEVGGADTQEESERASAVKDLLGRGEKLHEDELHYVAGHLEGGVDVYEGEPRRRVFEKALEAVRHAAEVVRPGTRRQASSGVTRALDVINRHRRGLGMSLLDPAAAGWSEQDVLLEAERVARFPNLGLTP